jgi:7-cyano-7-deazaguanine synthase in queuosine biosynthesis
MSIVATKDEKTCLLMFSGGYDTLLAPCYLIEKGYKVLLITYDNGLEKNMESVDVNVNRLTKLYGNNLEFLGIKSIMSIWRELFLLPYLLRREKFDYDLAPMELMCLSCRSSMYARSIVECLGRNIKYIAEGARESQGYPEQQRAVMEVFRELCKEHSIELVLPVYHIKNKEHLKEELLMRNIIPKTTEPYCTFAMPLYNYAPLEDRVKEMERFLVEYLMPKAQKIIKKLPDVIKARSGKGGLV